MNENQRGKIIVIDAIDGAGKSTIIRDIATFLESQGVTPSFDLVDFQKKHARLPEIQELQGVKLLLAAEPTSSWIGSALREELLPLYQGRRYSALSATQAFALDRDILYKRIIIPFLKANPDGFVIQDRGLISTLAYQPLQDPACTIEQILALPGNQTELSYPPDLLFLLTLDVNIAQQRLAERKDKRDNSLLEAKDFQSALVKRYKLSEVQEPFLKRGTSIVNIDASKTPKRTFEQVKKHILDLI